MNRGGRLLGGGRTLIGFGGFALTVSLAVFHGRLLWQRLADGSLLDPAVGARWALSGVLVLALLQLWSQGLPLLRGRRAVVLWLIIALVHVPASGAPVPAVGPLADGLLPAGLALLACLALRLGSGNGARSASRGRPIPRRSHPLRHNGTGWYRVLLSRPPPVCLHP